MEVKVSNISRLVDSDNIRNIFACIGEILHLNMFTNPNKKDGSQEADIVFLNPSEASLAVKLNKTQLGDRQFNVEPIMNRFRFCSSSSESVMCKVKFDLERCQENVRSALIRGLNSDLTRAQLEEILTRLVGDKPVMVSIYGKNILRPVNSLIAANFDAAMAVVEFSNRSMMLRSMLTLRAATPEKLECIVAPGLSLHIEEAWKCIDPEMKRPEQIAQAAILQAVASQKQTTNISSLDDEYRRGSREDISSSYQSRSSRRRSRSRSRSRERHRYSRSHRSSDRSRSRSRGRRYY